MLNQARNHCLGTGWRLIRPLGSCRALLLALLIAGCGQESADAPARMTAAITDPPPVILVPGAEASTLLTAGGEVLWAATHSSLGLYPDIVRNRKNQQRRLGRGKWPAFVWATIAAPRRYPFLQVRLWIDGAEAARRTPFA